MGEFKEKKLKTSSQTQEFLGRWKNIYPHLPVLLVVRLRGEDVAAGEFERGGEPGVEVFGVVEMVGDPGRATDGQAAATQRNQK